MRAPATLLAAIVAAATLSCTGAGDERAPASRTPHTPRRGGRVVVGFLGAPASLDPYAPNASDLTRALARPLYPSLFRFLPDGTARPYLARSVEQENGGTRVVLRRARWSNGKPITAGDVVASAHRATPPSGFAAFDRVARAGRRAVLLIGRVRSVPRALASAAFVLPEGIGGQAFGGPYLLRSYRPGLGLVLQRNRTWSAGPRPFLDRVTVRFVETLRGLLGLLERGTLDVGALPSFVNLRDVVSDNVRLDERRGWEMLFLDFRGSSLTPGERVAVGQGIDRSALQEAFVRDEGEMTSVVPEPLSSRPAALPSPRRPSELVQIAVPAGDELLELMQRGIFQQLDRAGIEADLVGIDQTTLYGPWARAFPLDAALRRSVTGPRYAPERSSRSLPAWPLFRVSTFAASRRGVHGPMPNPTFDGLLWNIERWWVER